MVQNHLKIQQKLDQLLTVLNHVFCGVRANRLHAANEFASLILK